MKYFFAATGEYLGGFDEGSLSLVPRNATEVLGPPSHGLDRLVNGVMVPYQPQLSPLEMITEAVKALPVAKRTNPAWGLFVNQCLLAIQHEDVEALQYLVEGYSTDDPDYTTILQHAKLLFNI